MRRLPTVTLPLPVRRITCAAIVTVGHLFGFVAPAWGQQVRALDPLPLFVQLDFEDLRQSNLSPLILTLWGYIAAETKVTESQEFGLSVVPHFGGHRVTTLERWTAWAAAGAAVGVLAAHAPMLQNPHLPTEALFAAGYGSAAGVVGGELVWNWSQKNRQKALRRTPVTFSLTVAAVRIERLRDPIALPVVHYAWVPALVGKW